MLWNTQHLVLVHKQHSTNVQDSTVHTHKPSKPRYITFYIKKLFLIKLLSLKGKVRSCAHCLRL